MNDIPDFTQYIVLVKQFSADELLPVIERFAYNLTVAIRHIWSNESMDCGRQLKCILLINEIQHRTTARIPNLRLGRDEWGADFWAMVSEYADQDPEVSVQVGEALRFSCGKVQRK
jgi:hypothetical protein